MTLAGDGPAPRAPNAPDGHNVIAGTIRRASYLGSETVYDVAAAGGQEVKVLRSNVARYEDRGFGEGDRVWLTWNARSPAVLLS